MKVKTIAALLLCAGLAWLPTVSHADDIDLYTGGENFSGVGANVLIVLDNSTNWASSAQHWGTAKQGESELQAIADVIGTLGDNLNVGLLLSSGSGGGYVRFAIREMNVPNRPTLQSMLNTMRANFGGDGDNDDKVNSASIVYDNMLNATFRYFNGKARFGETDLPSGSVLDLRDYDGNSNSSSKQPAYPSALGGYSLSSSTATVYSAPTQAAEGCAKNFIIFIGNGYPSLAGTKADLTAAAQLVGVTSTAITNDVPGGDNSKVADEWTKFMHDYGVVSVVDDPQNSGRKLWNHINTYTIDVCKDACDTDQEALLRSMAHVGGGKYFKSSSQAQIRNALASILSEIQAVNSVFASATLPISVNTQGTYENQVYIGVFRSDGQARPRWFGNLKEYQFARYCDWDGDDLVTATKMGIACSSAQLDTTAPSYLRNCDERIDGNPAPNSCSGDILKLFLADRNNRPAIDQSMLTGFIDQTSTSFWTSDSSYWTSLPTSSGSISDSPDGPYVERGGAGQRLRTHWGEAATSPHPDGRKIYTCLGTCLTTGDKTLSNSPFVANTEIITALAAPAGSVTINTLARSGNTVTAVTGQAHGFSINDSVVIAGVSPSAYNGTVTVASVPTSTSFTYTLPETPAQSVTGVTISASLTAVQVSSLTISPTTPGATATVTVTGTLSIPAGTTSATIAGASQSFLNGQKTGTTNGSGQFQFSVVLPPRPADNGGGVTAKCGNSASEIVASSSYNASTGVMTFSNPSTNLAGCKNTASGTLVVISGAADSMYNGTWSVATAGSKLFTVNYGVVTIRSPDPSVAASITPAGTATVTADITRAEGSDTFTATVQGGGTHPFSAGGAVMISGASDVAYNGNWTVNSVGAGSNSFTTGNVTRGPGTASGAMTARLSSVTSTGPTATNLINWSRGKDLWEDENLGATATNPSLSDVRASIHGDVLHSRPLLINFGGTIGVVGFYGSNDGFLRAVKGGIAATDGVEQWAFIPPEFARYSKLSRLYSNDELVRYPNSSCSASPTPTARTYFWDGQITAYQSPDFVYYTTNPASTTASEPTAGCSSATPATCNKRPSKTYLYAGMRRGGNAYYALDISVPAEPKFLWKIDNSLTDFTQLGQTWSEPKVAKIKAKAAGVDVIYDVLVFGGGYDPNDDDQPSGCPRGDHSAALSTSQVSSGVVCPKAGAAYSGVGRGVYVVNALTGTRLKFLEPPAGANKYSFPGDVTLLDIDGDGYVDRIYAADSGANLFRFDLDSTKEITAVDVFTAYHLASFGDRSSAGDATRNGGDDARMVLYPPEVVPFSYSMSDGTTSLQYMVLLGSGNREKPLPNRDVNDNLNTLECSSLYTGGAYFGNKIRDRFWAYIDKMNAAPLSADVPPPAVDFDDDQSDLFRLNTTTLTDRAVTRFKICYAFETTCDQTAADPSVTNPIYRGWRMTLKNSVNRANLDEEKLVSAPRVVSGLVLFGTNTPKAPNPSAGVCSNLGQALSYAVDPFTGLPSFDRNGDGIYDQRDYGAVVSGGGLPPTVTSGVVGIDGSFYRFVIGAGGTGTVSASPIAGARNPISLRGVRSRVFWYYQTDEK
jgi:type IV pilus assembly protein PilY1